MLKEDRKTKDQGSDPGALIQLLLQVPMEQFVGMVTKSGLPAADSTKLCLEFKRLKETA